MSQNPLQSPLMQIGRIIVALKPVLIHGIGVEGLKFIDDNFRAQGFRGLTLQKWQIQKRPNYPRPHQILILSGTYRRSWNQRDGSESTMLFSDAPQARAMNEGARGPISVTSSTGKTFIRNQNTPARPVIGPSPVLTHACEAFIIKKITDALPK